MLIKVYTSRLFKYIYLLSNNLTGSGVFKNHKVIILEKFTCNKLSVIVGSEVIEHLRNFHYLGADINHPVIILKDVVLKLPASSLSIK